MPNAKDVSWDTETYKIMLVGSYGTGKSTFAASWFTGDKPGFVFDFDDRIRSYAGKDFEYDTFPMTWKGWVEFEKTLLRVKKEVLEENKYSVIVVDSTTTMTDLAMERALQLDPKRSETNGPLWNIHSQMVKNLVEGRLRQISKDLPCDIIVIAHIDIKTDRKTGEVLSIAPLLTGQLSEKIPGYFDEVYYTTTRRKDNKTVYLLQTVPIGNTKARSVLSGKERRLPDFIGNSYDEIMKHLMKEREGKEVKKVKK